MGRTRYLAAAVAGILGAAGPAPASAEMAEAALCLTILHNNDAESQLLDAGAGEEAHGGAAEFVNVVRREHEDAGEHGCEALAPDEVPRAVLVLNSGDNFLAGPEFSASLEKGQPHFDSMVVDAIGYDALTIGNHEFDFGPEVLADFIESTGEDVPFLSANLDFSAEPELEALVDAGRIRSSVLLERAGFKIGIVGATTPALPFISSPRKVEVREVAPAVGIEIDRLHARGATIIVLISHLQSVDEDMALLAQLAGVDVAIAGGGSELLANHDTMLLPGDEDDVFGTYPLLAADAGGRTVPVITTPGAFRYLGRLEMVFDEAGDLLAATGDPVRVVRRDADDATAPDPTIEETVTKPVEAALQKIAATEIGESAVPLDGRRTSIRAAETNLGNLVADALLAAARRHAATAGVDEVHVAIQNGGGIRNDSLVPAGTLSELVTFDILPFPNFVTVVEDVDPVALKTIMENAVAAVEERGGRFAHIAGFDMVYDATQPAQLRDPTGAIIGRGSRVRSLVLDDGTAIVENGAVVEGAPTVNLATVDFLARGGDQYPIGEDFAYTPLGVTYQQALSRYIQEDLDGVITAEDYPEGGDGRIATVQ